MSGSHFPTGRNQFFFGTMLLLCITWPVLARAEDMTPGNSLLSAEARAAAKVVRSYYEARDHFNLSKGMQLEAPDIVLIDEDGERHPGNPALLKDFMAYEKATHGHWHCRVLDFKDGWLEAEITEENDYYKYLGIGNRTEHERYRVADGKIHERWSISSKYSGRDQDSAYHEFKDWLQQVPERQTGVMRDGHLVFDGESAKRMLPLLQEFSRLKAGTQPTDK
jgi:hypothetical protein